MRDFPSKAQVHCLVVDKSDESAVRAFRDHVCAYLEARLPFVLLIDARNLESPPNATTRRSLVDWLGAIEPKVIRYNVATAIVYRSTVVELLIRGIIWFAPPPNPQLNTTDLHAAEQWCLEQSLPVSLRQRNVGADRSFP